MLSPPPPTEFYIPPRTGVVVLGDFFASDLVGGAELTTEALIQACPRKPFRLHSHSLTEEFLQENDPTKFYWVLTNYTNIPGMSGLQALVESGTRYSVVEYDWKFCRQRAPRTCALDKQGGKCPCMSTAFGSVFNLVFGHADHVFWMSEQHRQEHQDLTGVTHNPAKHHVQGSTWTEEDLNYLRELRATRTLDFPNTYAVLDSNSWIKGTQETRRWCEERHISHRLVGGLGPKEFLKELSRYQGLVFRPADRDTCPRVVVEAKLLGLDLLMNDNVQHIHDTWWKEATCLEDIETHLRTQRESFWKTLF